MATRSGFEKYYSEVLGQYEFVTVFDLLIKYGMENLEVKYLWELVADCMIV